MSSPRDVPTWAHAVLPPIPFLIEAGTLALGRPVRDRYFGGEFGFYEVGTACLALLAGALAIAVLRDRPPFPWQGVRIWIAFLAVGSLLLAGEETSWGQHVFGWEAGGLWGQANYQQETNLHNLDYFAITNQPARNFLTVFIALGCVVFPVLRATRWVRPPGMDRAAYWIWPSPVLLGVALLVLIPPIPRKVGLPSMPVPGETEEFYMALFLALYAWSILLRKRFVRLEGGQVCSVA